MAEWAEWRGMAVVAQSGAEWPWAEWRGMAVDRVARNGQ